MTTHTRKIFGFIPVPSVTAVFLPPCYTLPGSMVLAGGGFDALLPRFPTGRTFPGVACPVLQFPAPAHPPKGSSGEEKVKFPQKGSEEKKPNNF